jgi:D-alanyl-D-alanine carboxypeptidase
VTELETRLFDAANVYPFPETPDVVGRLGARAVPRRSPVRSFAIVVAVAIAAVTAVLALSPSARSSAARWFEWLPRVEVARTSSLEPFPLRAAPPYLGHVATVGEAQERIAFPIRTPLDGTLGAPTIYLRDDVIGGIVTFVYGEPAEPRLVLSEWLAANATARYQVAGTGGRIDRVRVGDSPGLWIEGDTRAVYTYLGADRRRHEEQLPVSANVLLWREGPVAFRLEARTELEEALSVARSIGRATPILADASRALRKTGAPAVILFAIDDGRESVAALGFADLRRRARARAGDRFWIGSVSKTFTAAVVLQLVGEGKLSLDDPVSRWLPELPNGDGIAVRRLLDHTSGLPDYFRVPQIARRLSNPRAVIPVGQLIRITAAEPRDFEPGTSYGYSSTNYLVLGAIVQRVTGRGIGTEIRERILGKLGLARTTFGRPASPMRGYSLSRGRRQDVTAWTLGGPWADGAVWSDARGVAGFFSALLGGGLLGSAELEKMLTKTPPSLMGLGIGGEPASCGRIAWGHGGSTPGFETFALATRDADTVVVAVANAGGHRVGHELFHAAERLFCRLTR